VNFGHVKAFFNNQFDMMKLMLSSCLAGFMRLTLTASFLKKEMTPNVKQNVKGVSTVP